MGAVIGGSVVHCCQLGGETRQVKRWPLLSRGDATRCGQNIGFLQIYSSKYDDVSCSPSEALHEETFKMF